MKFIIRDATTDDPGREFTDKRAAFRCARERADTTCHKHALFAVDGPFTFLVHEFEPIFTAGEFSE